MNRFVRPLCHVRRSCMLGSLAPLRCQNVSICSHSINLTSSAAISRQFSIFSRFSRKKKKQKTAEELEAYDINRLEEIIPISMALSNLTVKNLHPLHEVSRAIKESLTSSDPSFGDDAEVKTFIKTNYVHLLGKNVAKELERFDGLHLYRQHCILDNLNDPNTNTDMDIRSKTKDVSSEVMETSSSSSAGAVTAPEEPRIHNQTDSEYYLEHRENFETMIRLRLLHNYIRRIQRAVHDDEIQVSILDTHAKCCSLVDAFLRGTPSERIAEHIELYGPTLTPWLTQACFYAYCEPELETLVDFWYGDLERAAVLPTRKRRFLPFLTTSVTPKIKPSAIQKENLRLFLEHKKHLLPFSKAYLLDTLELNTKARCCFAWTDSEYKGFRPIEETLVAANADIVASRRLYFAEATDLSKQFVTHYVGTRRAFYNDKREMRKTLRQGAWFTLACAILDIGIASI